MADSYAVLADVLARRRQATNDQGYRDAVETALVDTTRDLIGEIGYPYFRVPAEGTEAVVVNSPGGPRLHVHQGIAALDLVEIRYATTDDWIELADTDWYLEAAPDVLDPLPGEPWFHVMLDRSGNYGTFPCGPRLVRLTMATGWPSMPTYAVSANVAWARQRVALDPGLAPQLGPEELGNPTGPDRWPRAVYDLVMRERERHWCAF